MVPFFVGYALIVWYLACRHRRTLAALVVLLVGVAGLLALNYLHYRLGLWSRARDPDGQGIYLPVLQSIMYPYTAMVAVVGGYVALLPRRVAPGRCPACAYDLAGLDAQACPECGSILVDPPPAPGPHRRSGVRRENLRASDGAP